MPTQSSLKSAVAIVLSVSLVALSPGLEAYAAAGRTLKPAHGGRLGQFRQNVMRVSAGFLQSLSGVRRMAPGGPIRPELPDSSAAGSPQSRPADAETPRQQPQAQEQDPGGERSAGSGGSIDELKETVDTFNKGKEARTTAAEQKAEGDAAFDKAARGLRREADAPVAVSVPDGPAKRPAAALEKASEAPAEPGSAVPAPSGAPRTIWNKGFSALMGSYGLGVFNEWAMKTAFSFWLYSGLPAAQAALWFSLGQLGLVIPFILNSGHAGRLADRMSKPLLIKRLKVVEIAIMAGFVALTATGAPITSLAAQLAGVVLIFASGMHSTYMSPSRESLIPKLVPQDKVTDGNAIASTVMMLGMVGGMIGGSYFFVSGLMGEPLMALAAMGYLISRLIPERASQPSAGVSARSSSFAHWPLLMVNLGIAMFWFVGTIANMNIMPYAKALEAIGASAAFVGAHPWLAAFMAFFPGQGVTTLFLVGLSAGIAAGAVLSAVLSRNARGDLGLVKYGAASMLAALLAAGFAPATSIFIPLFALVGMGIGAGMYLNSLATFLQKKSMEGTRATKIGEVNRTGFINVALAALIFMALQGWFSVAPALIFKLSAALMIAPLILSIRTDLIIPKLKAASEWFYKVRRDGFVDWLGNKLIDRYYKVEVTGEDNIPKEGGALLVSDHDSYLNPVLTMTRVSTSRKISFLMWAGLLKMPGVKTVTSKYGAMPVDESNPKLVIAAIRQARKRVLAGSFVGIYPTGTITRLAGGMMTQVMHGYQKIISGTGLPIIPMAMDSYGSIFSWERKRFLFKRPLEVPFPVTAVVGKPLPETATPLEIHETIEQLAVRTYAARLKRKGSIVQEFARAAKSNWNRLAAADSRGSSTYGELLAASLLWGKELEIELGKTHQVVGVAAGRPVEAAAANLALAFGGRTIVSLDPTDPDSFRRAAAAGMTAVVGSKEALTELDSGGVPMRFVDIQTLSDRASAGAKDAMKELKTSSIEEIERRFLGAARPKDDDRPLAILIQRSGRQVELTQKTILANVTSLAPVLRLKAGDRVAGNSSIETAYGYVANMWLPLTHGAAMIRFPGTHATGAVGEILQLSKAHQPTVLLGDPELFGFLAVHAQREDLKKIREAVSAGPSIDANVADRFKRTFGVLPMEAFAVDEAGGVVTINVEDYKDKRLHHVGNKRGSIGQPLRGFAARVAAGKLEVLTNGSPDWLKTDIAASRDADGFLFLPPTAREQTPPGTRKRGRSLEEQEAIEAELAKEMSERIERSDSIADQFLANAQRYWNRMATADATSTDLSIDDELKAAALMKRIGELEKPVPGAGAFARLMNGLRLRAAKFKLGRIDLAPPGKAVTYGELLTGAYLLGEKLSFRLDRSEPVGMLLPPSNAGAAANLGLILRGYTVANLNYSTMATVPAAMDVAGIKKIVTSRRFIHKLGIPPEPNMIFLEDIRPEIGKIAKIAAYLSLSKMSAQKLKSMFPDAPRGLDDVIAYNFTSGTEGPPKAVPLTQRMLLGNLIGTTLEIKLKGSDVVMGALPFFHVFGFVGTLLLPLTAGIGAVYHAKPTDGKTIGALVKKYQASIIFGTPSFLNGYRRQVKQAGLFASLRIVISGAEKLYEDIRAKFEEKFGVPIVEGYGTTEAGPVLALNTPDIVVNGEVVVVNNGIGTVGLPSRGTEIRLIDVKAFEKDRSFAPVKWGEEGLIVARGPNIMKGYLNNPKKNAESFIDGWYITGDLGVRDESFRIKITDRLSESFKVAGEMVPANKLKSVFADTSGLASDKIVVTAIPDEKKGSRIIVFIGKPGFDAAAVYEKVKDLVQDKKIPAVWLPKLRDIHVIDKIPMLPTGKVDKKLLKKMALERSAA